MTILVESRTNRLGIEVRLEDTGHGTQRLRAYRLGRLCAERFITLRHGRGEVSRSTVELIDLTREQLAEVEQALDEGVRVRRDGRGLCECA
jgi:hypothetical protein